MPTTTHESQPVLDVAIVGAGQAGMAAAAVLQQYGIPSVMLDQAPEGQEGPWVTSARMETLRSPKELTGPALGLPNLTFRAWFEAQFGSEAWDELDKIPRPQWMDYLRWYRKALDVRDAQGERTVLARRIVWATGRDGLGGPAVPDFVRHLPRGKAWIHAADIFDYSSLRGLRVGVVGGGSAAMDSAATALENGAASVDLLIRRADLPRVNKSKGSSSPGLVHGNYYLPDELKWRIRHYQNGLQVPPPHGSTLRVSRHANAYSNFSCPIERVDQDGKIVRVATPKGVFTFDILITATGFAVDWTQRPELAAIAPHVRTWRERYAPPAGDEDEELARMPDLGAIFEFQERVPGACPGLDRVHCFCYPATISHGSVAGDIPAISVGARRLGQGLARLFYEEDADHHYARLQAYDDPELFGDEWVPADSAQRVKDLEK
jgi:cation diffusion facilitator CzcD-associated flavoprotein CzcO